MLSEYENNTLTELSAPVADVVSAHDLMTAEF